MRRLILVQAFTLSFESGEYTSIKNSVLVLTKVAKLYPLQYATCSKLEASVATLILAEKREDLKILATGYVAHSFILLRPTLTLSG